MTHNLQLGPDVQINQLIQLLRTEKPTGKIPCEHPIIPGVRFSFDPAARFKGQLQNHPDSLLSFKIDKIEGSDWFALHISLGDIDLSAYDVIGFVCKSDAPNAMIYRACLRSGSEAGFSDCFFDKHIVAHSETSTHLDVIDIAQKSTLPKQAEWRDFILFLPADRPLALNLRDLRFFIV